MVEGTEEVTAFLSVQREFPAFPIGADMRSRCDGGSTVAYRTQAEEGPTYTILRGDKDIARVGTVKTG
jgi:hypothetical protein